MFTLIGLTQAFTKLAKKGWQSRAEVTYTTGAATNALNTAFGLGITGIYISQQNPIALLALISSGTTYTLCHAFNTQRMLRRAERHQNTLALPALQRKADQSREWMSEEMCLATATILPIAFFAETGLNTGATLAPALTYIGLNFVFNMCSYVAALNAKRTSTAKANPPASAP